jgi:hypothetical protein
MSPFYRYIIILSIVFSGVFSGKVTSAQIYHSDVSFKDSLIQLLFQYGREVYYRGIDPQEASYVFQRILTLECSHNGAQDYLGKIHDKYPEVSIKIQGCREINQQSKISPTRDEKNLKENKVPSLRKDRMLSGTNLNISDVIVIDEENTGENEIINRSTPLYAYSNPILIDPNPTDISYSLTESTISSSINNVHSKSGQDSTGVIKPVLNKYDHGLTTDCEHLQGMNDQLHRDITALESQIREKDVIITGIENELAKYKGMDSASYAAIASDQRDLIRIQQGNIDYLQKELDDVKEQVLYSGRDSDPAIVAMHKEIANSQLLAKENEMHLEAKNREAQLLQKQLGEMQEQLQLVKRILSEKNDIINSLRDELESIKLESGK